jgi:pimeloyl-[acyl-carrier protein] methyl ester esterase
VTLYIQAKGAGPDLVLIHGWAMHGGVWDGVGEDLARDFRLHIVDLPGHGRSDLEGDLSLDGMARAVAEQVSANAVICGWSLGAQVALRIAGTVPERVSKLVLVAATPCFVRRSGWEFGVERSVLEAFAADLDRDYEGTLRRFLALQARGGDAARALMARLRATLFDRGRPTLPILQSGLRILLESDIRADMAAVQQRALLIHGENDMLAPAGAGRWLVSSLPRARLALIPHCAHAPFLSHPILFTQLVREFLRDG